MCQHIASKDTDIPTDLKKNCNNLTHRALHGDTGSWASTWASPIIDGEGMKMAVQMVLQRIASLGLKDDTTLPYKELRAMYGITFNNYMRNKSCKYH